MKIDMDYAVLVLIEILFEKGLVNEKTYTNVKQNKKLQNNVVYSHISQVA